MKYFCTTLLCLCTLVCSAQLTERPSILGLGFSSNMYDGDLGSEVFDLSEASIGFQAGVGYQLNPSLALILHSSWTKANFDENTADFKDQFAQGDLALEYHFNNGYLLPYDARLQPYLTFGMGVSAQNGRGFFDIPVGAGLRIPLNETLSFSLSSVYNIVGGDGYKYLQNSLGIILRKKPLPREDLVPPDNDGDGVPNAEDACPNDAGSIATQGCPDGDGDGVRDEDDKCPEVAGPKELGGCPDGDGDGVVDVEDSCPQVAGNLNGCPDSDGDGVADKDDNCPQVAGVASLDGCPEEEKPSGPDADGDGIIDSEDACPERPGLAEDNGCPASDKELKEALIPELLVVRFQFGKSELTEESAATLDRTSAVLRNYPDYNVTLAGHTDSTGPDEVNLELSRARAQEVKNYMVERGVDANRLVVEGAGEDEPIAGNDTVEGRATNRRVQVLVIYN